MLLKSLLFLSILLNIWQAATRRIQKRPINIKGITAKKKV